jgi:putative DNA primase/helicase
MPGDVPEGSAVRLYPHNGALGIAEGIETAIAASELFKVPVWAALTESRLKTWEPPADVHTVYIFGDNDENLVGQSAAFALAKRLGQKRIVKVEIPPSLGQDWNDFLLQERRCTVHGRLFSLSSSSVRLSRRTFAL